MASRDIPRSRLRADKRDDDFEEFFEDKSSYDGDSIPGRSGSPDIQNGSQSPVSSRHDSSEDDTGSSQPDVANPTSHISFGALASAQASLNRKRKRNESRSHRPERSPSPFHEAVERRAGAKQSAGTPSSRTSKHAPTEMSSKRAVTRKRSVVDVPSVPARDPRFSSLSGRAIDARTLERRYGFLNDYRATELAGLKKQLRETKQETEKERLKREIKATEDRERTRKKVEAQQEVIREHRHAEREKIKEGKQPYFLKKSDIKKKLLEKRFEELGQKKAEKVMERRRRKQAAKERKEMPWSRRKPGSSAAG